MRWRSELDGETVGSSFSRSFLFFGEEIMFNESVAVALTSVSEAASLNMVLMASVLLRFLSLIRVSLVIHRGRERCKDRLER